MGMTGVVFMRPMIARPSASPITCRVIDRAQVRALYYASRKRNTEQASTEGNIVDRRSLLKMSASAATATGAAAAAGLALHATPALPQARNDSPIVEPPRASFIHRKDGTALFYRDWGVGTPVLFVHSAGLNSEMWAYQMMPLTAQGFRCVAFDRRGHGRSSDPGRGYDFDTLADDLAAVIDALDLRNVTLVGHSMGCAEIARYLTRHGSGRIKRVALIAPTTPFLLKTENNPNGVDRVFFQQVRAQWLRDFPKWIAENTDPFFVPGTSSQIKQWGTQMMYATSMQAHIECNIALTETDFREELKRLRVPVLVLHGTKDVSAPLPLTGQPTAQLIPGAELKVYEGAPHGIFVTHLEQVNQDLLRFIRS
jgi:non-heme chloroperoxidase